MHLKNGQSTSGAARSQLASASPRTFALDGGRHGACVDAWLQRVAAGQSAHGHLRLFEAALNAFWARTVTTLGVVTLTAITDRVLHYAVERFPELAALELDPTAGVQYRALYARLGSLDDSGLLEGIRFVLVEFLTVLGNLTAELLTPELHAELAKTIAPPATPHIEKSKPSPSPAPGSGDEDQTS